MSGPEAAEPSFTLRSEFATAVVTLDRHANGPRLRVTDASSGAEIHLDPLELVSLARSRHRRLEQLIMTDDYLIESDEWALDHL